MEFLNFEISHQRALQTEISTMLIHQRYSEVSKLRGQNADLRIFLKTCCWVLQKINNLRLYFHFEVYNSSFDHPLSQTLCNADIRMKVKSN